VGIRSRLAELLSRAPEDAAAIEFEKAWWTWGRLAATSRALDEMLAEHGLGAGARIGVALENRPEHVAVVVCLIATGRCMVTLSPLQPAERLSADITRSAPAVVIASADVLARDGVAGAVPGIFVELTPDGSLSVVSGRPPLGAETSPGVAVEMLTSGTTGPPKRIELRDEQLDAAIASSGQRPRAGALLTKGTGLVSTPLVHIGGLWGAVAGLQAGRSIVLQPRFTLDGWVDAVERHRIRAAGLVPAALRTVLDADVPVERLASLDVVLCGTAPCPADLADSFFRQYGARVLMTYGATEFAGAVAGWTLPLHQKWWDRKAGSAGRPFPGVTVRVVGADGAELPTGHEGHLEIRTSQASVGDAWVRTADLASIDEDRFLWIVGRADDAIIRGGFKVHPGLVCQVLEKHPSVLEAAVAGLPDDRLGAVPVAGVELRPGAEVPSVDELLAHCREHLTPYEVPAHIVVLDELPRTPSSKVSRVDLIEAVQSRLEGAA
jgi:long-chain acyl-CoA synthetase